MRTLTMRISIVVCCCLAGLPGAMRAQTPLSPAHPAASTAATPQDPLNRESPQSSVYSFLQACHSRDYTRAIRYLDLRNRPADERLKDGTELAQQLEQILDRDAQFDVAALSRNPEGDLQDAASPDLEHVDSFRVDGKTVELQLQRITLHSGVRIWLFSSASLSVVPQIAVMASNSWIERHLPPPLVDWKLIDTALWRWIALIALALALAVLSRWIAVAFLFALNLILKRFLPRADGDAIKPFAGPFRLLLSTALYRAGLEWIDPSALVRLYLIRTLALFFFAGLAWLFMRIIDLIVRQVRVTMEKNRQSFSYSVLPLANRVIKLVIFLLATAAVLGNWGYNTTTILAGLGVGGIAIALAAQKTIENFFGGVAVVTDRPVSVGDDCKFGNQTGTVEDIGLRSTRIRTADRTVVTIPNGQFSSMTIESFANRDKMLFHFMLSLRRDTRPEQVRALLQSIGKALQEHPKVEAGTMPVRFVGVGTYSLDLEVSVYILTQDGDEFLRIQQDLLLWILDAVESAGTALALPTQASVTYSPETNTDQTTR